MRRTALAASLTLATALALGAGPRLALASAAIATRAASVSYSTWIVRDQSVLLRFALPAAEAERLTGGALAVLTVSKVGDYVLQHTDVAASGQPCPAIDQGYDLGKVDPVNVGPGLYGLEIVFRCPGEMKGLELHDHVLFAQAPSHVDFAQIEADGRTAQQLYTAQHQRLRVPDSRPMTAAGVWPYARLGCGHLLHSALRLCFLLAAICLVRCRRDFAGLFGYLAIGYALALVVDATGWTIPDMSLTGAFIAMLTGLLAVVSIATRLERPRAAIVGWPGLLLTLAIGAAFVHAPRAALLLAGGALASGGLLAIPQNIERRPRFWLATAAVFAFLDGFTLPSLLTPLHLAPAAEIPMVAGYMAGSLFAATIVLGLAAAVALAVLRSGFATALHPIAAEVAAAGLAGLGTFWLVTAAGTTRGPPQPAVQISIPQTLESLGHVPPHGESLLMRQYKLEGNTLCHPTPPDTC